MGQLAEPTVPFCSLSLLHVGYQPYEHSEKHTDPVSRISIVLRGEVREEVHGRTEWASAGSIVVKPADIPHRDDYGPSPTHIVSVELNEDWIRERGGGNFDRCRWFHDLRAARAAREFLFALQAAPHPSEPLIAESVLQLLAALPQATAPSPRPDWLQRVEERLRDTYREPVSTAELASWIDLHPVYLARVFRHHYGCSIAQFLHRLRLKSALHQLASSEQTLVQVALDHGYADQSHFTRMLRASLATTPQELRNYLRNFSMSKTLTDLSDKV